MLGPRRLIALAPFRSFAAHVDRLRRLSQPYFLPPEADGRLFAALLVALLAVVAGTALLLLTALVGLAGATPALREHLLPGLAPQLQRIWHGPPGALVLGAFAAGLGAFAAARGQLREGRWLPWLMLGTLTLLMLTINGTLVGMSFLSRRWDNALVAYDPRRFWDILRLYVLAVATILPVVTVYDYLTPRLGVLWRRWLTDRMLGRYLDHRAYYVLNPNDEGQTDVDNPDQRLSEDVNSFTATILEVSLELINSLLTFFSFILVLWSISTALSLLLLVYALIGTTLSLLAGRRLVGINVQQLRLEADFRYGLVHIRDNAEAIAFYGGEPQEAREAQRRLGSAIRNFNRLIVWQTVVKVLQRSYDYFSGFLPYLVLAPLYFSHRVDFGVFGQASIAFGAVFASVSYIVTNIDRLAAFSASIHRLEGFQGKLDAVAADARAAEAVAAEAVAAEALAEAPGAEAILLQHVDLIPPGSERRLLHDLSLRVGPGERLLVVGPSGCGKTSLLRLVSGLWPAAAGSVRRPPPGSLLFIPQKPYMVLGSLRDQLCYPLPISRFHDDQLRATLEEVRLAHLVDRYPDLSLSQDWSQVLSLGEQQRLAFARLLLTAPRFVVLDEATSALDVATERRLYELLRERGLAFVSVGHRPSLVAFHDTVLELDGRGDWRLRPAAGYVLA